MFFLLRLQECELSASKAGALRFPYWYHNNLSYEPPRLDPWGFFIQIARGWASFSELESEKMAKSFRKPKKPKKTKTCGPSPTKTIEKTKKKQNKLRSHTDWPGCMPIYPWSSCFSVAVAPQWFCFVESWPALVSLVLLCFLKDFSKAYREDSQTLLFRSLSKKGNCS